MCRRGVFTMSRMNAYMRTENEAEKRAAIGKAHTPNELEWSFWRGFSCSHLQTYRHTHTVKPFYRFDSIIIQSESYCFCLPLKCTHCSTMRSMERLNRTAYLTRCNIEHIRVNCLRFTRYTINLKVFAGHCMWSVLLTAMVLRSEGTHANSNSKSKLKHLLRFARLAIWQSSMQFYWLIRLVDGIFTITLRSPFIECTHTNIAMLICQNVL